MKLHDNGPRVWTVEERDDARRAVINALQHPSVIDAVAIRGTLPGTVDDVLNHFLACVDDTPAVVLEAPPALRVGHLTIHEGDAS